MKKLVILYFSLALFLFASVGKIAVAKGEVFVVRDGESIPAASGFELMQNDTVTTAEGSRAQLVFNDETVVSVGKGSEFVVESYAYEADAGAQAQEASFKSLKGAFKTITGKIGKVAPEKFTLATKTATIGIRGTHFLGKINIDGDKIACTHGAISVAAFAGGPPIVVSAGQITSVLVGAMPTPPRKYTVTEITQLNEASGAAPQEGEAKPEAKPEGEGKGEKGGKPEAKQGPLAEGPGGEPGEEPVPLPPPPPFTEPPVAGPPLNPVPPDLPPPLPTPPEGIPDPGSGGEPKIVLPTTGGYPMTYIAASGPVDLYGKSLESSINAPECKKGDCSLSSSTSWVDYFYYSAQQFYRNGADVLANEDGTGENLGVGSEVIIKPELTDIQSFFAAIEGSYTDAGGTLGEGDDITGVQMMTTAAGNYEGYNVEYRLDTNDPGDTDTWQEHNYLAYDNLGEFIISTNETTDASLYGEMYRSSIFMGKKSSWDDLADAPDHLIYKVLMVNSVYYDGSSDFSSYMYNGLATGTDYSGSRAIGNTNNGNFLYISRPQHDGRGWGIVLGTAAQGSDNEILIDGNLHMWAYGEKDIDGYYSIEGQVDTEVEGEIYGSELQGFGMSISSTTPSVFDQTVLTTQTNPTEFEETLVAGFRTDDATGINLDTELTGTATMSGFTASKIYVEGSGSEALGFIDLSINRDSGSISGSIKMGEDIATPYYTVTIDGTGGSTSAFISDDYFASVLTGATDYSGTDLTPDYASNAYGGMMATNSGFALDDVTWGYWMASYDSGATQFHHKSTWVAGIDTPSSKLDELVAAAGGAAGVEVMTYEGKILGRVNGYGPSGNINSDASWVHIAVDFGSSTPVSGSMVFTVIEYPELVWYVDIGSSGENTFDQSSGAMVALLSGNSNSIVSVKADPYSGATEAGGLNADLYGAEGTAIGGNFFVSGTIDNLNYLTALGVFKGATDQSLTAPVVGDQKILVGSQMSTWLDNPTGTDDNRREASKTDGTMGGYMDSSAFYISLDGDTGTYRSFGDLSYSSTYSGGQFAANTPEYEEGESGSLTLGTVTAQTETTMTTAVGGYSGVSAEDLSDSTTDKFVVYDNLKEFFIILESSDLDADSEAYRSLLFAGTPYAGMTGETDTLIGYNWVASVDRTFADDELSSGAGSPLLSGDGITYSGATTVINRNTGVVVSVGKPGTDSYGTYLDGMIGTFNETYGSVNGYAISVNSGGIGSEEVESDYFGGELYGSANQGLGMYVYGNYNSATYEFEDVEAVAGVRVDTPNNAALNPTTDTDGSTGTAEWTGSLAGVRNAASGDPFEHGIIELLTIDKDSGIVESGYLTLGAVSGGMVTTASEYIDIDPTSSAYASDDYMVMGFDAADYGGNYFYAGTDGGGVMVTSPDGVEDDYASWGYWGASFGDPSTTGFEFIPISTWVAGQAASPTVMAALETANTSMSFSGHVLGYVSTFNNTTSQFENFQAIDTVNSTVSLSVDFGTTNPISGNITFSPTADSALVWSMDVGTNTITAANAGFDVSSFSTGAGSTVVVGNSEMHGNFYGDGSSVTSLGGSFASAGLYGTDVVSANGVVKATKNP